MSLDTIFFDLDDTLYPRDNGVWRAVRERIERFMGEELRIAPEQISSLREHYLVQFGTTLHGLVADYGVDPELYLDYVHQVPIEDMLPPNPRLSSMLGRLPQQKFVFTNASQAHSRRVLAALGVQAYFQDIVSIESLNYVSKPDPGAYLVALQASNGSQAENCLYLDDRLVNLIPAKSLGMSTVLVGNGDQADGADHHIQSVEDLLSVLPWLVE